MLIGPILSWMKLMSFMLATDFSVKPVSFSGEEDFWPCSFCCQVYLRNENIVLGASTLPLLFHHFESIPNFLKYEDVLI